MNEPTVADPVVVPAYAPLAVPSEVDVAGGRDVRPKPAPVHAPLTGKERAGVLLTWGVLGLIIVFLTVMIAFVWLNERRTDALLTQMLGRSTGTAPAGIDTVGFRLLAFERSSFRTFWSTTVQTVLLNVLLPVLTALLGYVFGTTQARAVKQAE